MAPVAAMGVLALVGALVLAHLTRGTTFYADEWDWILHRRHGGLATFLNPHEQHLSLVPLIVYRALFATVGIRHYWPYLAVTIAAQVAVSTLVFVYALRRVPVGFALGGAALVMFFGPGSIDFLWAFQMAWLFAVAAGIAALLALDRRDRRGDVLACVFMGVALASAGPGLAIAIGLAVEVVWTRGRRAAWIAGAPFGVYALWWVTDQQASILPETLLHVATFTANAAAAALAGLLGLLALDPSSDSTTFHLWGPVVVVIAVGALVWRLRVLWPVAPRVWALLVMVVAFWLITALGRGAFRAGPLVIGETGDESRYIYVGAVLIVVLTLELVRGIRLARPVSAVLAVALLAAIASNLGALRLQAAYLRSAGAQTAAYLATLDMTRGVVAPTFDSAGFLLGIVPAGQYFAAEHDLGSPALTPARLSASSDTVRYLADRQLAAIDGAVVAGSPTVAASAIPGAAAAPVVQGHAGVTVTAAGRCVRVSAQPTSPGVVPGAAFLIPSGGLRVRADGGSAALAMRRFAARWGALGTVRAGPWVLLRLPADHARVGWGVQIAPTDVATVCGAAS